MEGGGEDVPPKGQRVSQYTQSLLVIRYHITRGRERCALVSEEIRTRGIAIVVDNSFPYRILKLEQSGWPNKSHKTIV